MRMKATARNMLKMVFTKKRLPLRCRLLMLRRPSATTCGMEEKSSSMSTSLATLRAASEPLPMATLQSAACRAKTSLTPSPVMATV